MRDATQQELTGGQPWWPAHHHAAVGQKAEVQEGAQRLPDCPQRIHAWEGRRTRTRAPHDGAEKDNKTTTTNNEKKTSPTKAEQNDMNRDGSIYELSFLSIVAHFLATFQLPSYPTAQNSFSFYPQITFNDTLAKSCKLFYMYEMSNKILSILNLAQ